MLRSLWSWCLDRKPTRPQEVHYFLQEVDHLLQEADHLLQVSTAAPQFLPQFSPHPMSLLVSPLCLRPPRYTADSNSFHTGRSCSLTLAIHTCTPECLHSTHTWMSAFHAYLNVCIPHIPKCLHTTHTQSSAFHTYSIIYIPHIPNHLHSTQIWMSAFHAYPNVNAFHTNPNVCIPHIPEYQHSMHTWMSAFHTYLNVCIPHIPECLQSTTPNCLHSTHTWMSDTTFYSSRRGLHQRKSAAGADASSLHSATSMFREFPVKCMK